MDVLDFYTKVYGRLCSKNYILFRLMTPLRTIVRKHGNFILPGYLKRHSCSPKICKRLLVSFTSYPARINDVWKVVECLKKQTVLPEKIILWLSYDQFKDRSSIPEEILRQEDGLFEVRLVEGDIRSHKKYYYAFQQFPDWAIITCDDDVYYDKNMIKRLVETAKLFPGCVIANHSTEILFDGKGDVLPYCNWSTIEKPHLTRNRLQIGIGGVLYPPHSLDEMVLDMNVFMSVAPHADDIWLNAMARLKKTPVVQTSKWFLSLPVVGKSSSLSDINNGENKNNIQIQALRKYLLEIRKIDIYTSEYQVEYNKQ